VLHICAQSKGIFSVFASKQSEKDVGVQDAARGPVNAAIASNYQRQDTQYDHRQHSDDQAGATGFDAATAAYGGADKIAPPSRMTTVLASRYATELPQPPYQAYMQQQMSQQSSRHRDAYAS
jgi:hypothetical protein